MLRSLRRLGKDGASALILLAFCGFGFYQTTGYPAQAAQWPRWVFGALAVLSLCLLVSAIRNAREEGR